MADAGTASSAVDKKSSAGLRLLAAAEYTLDRRTIQLMTEGVYTINTRIQVCKEPSVWLEVYTRPSGGSLTMRVNEVQSSEPIDLKVDLLSWKQPGDGEVNDFSKWPGPTQEKQSFRHIDKKVEATSPTIDLCNGTLPKSSCLYNQMARIQVKIQVMVPVQVDGLRRQLNETRLLGLHCDVAVRVGDATLPAHRGVLSAASKVFESMLSREYNFKEAKQDGCVQMEGTSREVVAKFLEYLYTDGDGLEDWAGLEVELLELAEMYAMDRLKADCKLRLWLADAPRALALLEQSFSQPLFTSPLRRRWVRVVADNFPAVSGSAEWEAFRANFAPLADAILELNGHVPSLFSTSLDDS